MILAQDYIIQVVQEYFKDKPVKRVYLFGSYANGQANDNSDVDFYVEIDYSKRLGWGLFKWRMELEENLNKSVDLVSKKGVSTFIAPFIHEEKKLIYEK